MNQPDFEPLRLLVNNAPLQDFYGLSPTEMYHLLYDAYGDESPLALRNEIDSSTLDRIHFFRLTEEFLKIVIREKSIKLTPLGALPRKTVLELHSHKFITKDIIEVGAFKLSREQDSIAITSVHLNTLGMGATRKLHGRLGLTKRGQQLLQTEQRVNLFRETLSSYTERFNWSSNDGYPPAPVGQLGWGFTVYLLERFGQSEQPIEFYTDRYLKAFPTLLEAFPKRQYGTPMEDFANCYRVRVFERFLEWFGFVTIEHIHEIHGRQFDTVKRTDLFQTVFRFT